MMEFLPRYFASWRGVFLAYMLGCLFISYLLAAVIMSNAGALAGTLGFGLSKFFQRTTAYMAARIDTAQWSNESCQGPICLNESIRARLLREETQHLKNILDLVDGFGRPLGRIFDPELELTQSTSSFRGVISDTRRQTFKLNVINFLRHSRTVDGRLLTAGLRILGRFYSRFEGVGPGGHLNTALVLLETTRSFRHDDIGRIALQNHPRFYIQEVDSIVFEILKNFTAKIIEEVETVLPELQVASTTAEVVRPIAVSLLAELDSEKARIQQTLRDLPWWDRFSLAHLFGRSSTSHYTTYLRFLADREQTIRFYGEGIQIVADNLLQLIDYISWYRRRQSTPIDARHILETLPPEDEFLLLRRAIDEFLRLAETSNKEYMDVVTPPHRLVSDGVLSTLPAF